jgi:hypothetical protein
VTLFLAHKDVVVGFVIFHTKLSTPRLACFNKRAGQTIITSKRKKEEKKALLHGTPSVWKYKMF